MAAVSVHALSTGSLTLPERFFVSPADENAKRTVPSLSFLIQHKEPGQLQTTRVLFDLGMRREVSLLPNELQRHCESRRPISTHPDVVESLAQGGLTVDDIDLVIFSHVHWDHVGLPNDFSNPKTRFVVGPGALDLLSGKSKLDIGSHNFFEPDLLPMGRTIELPSVERRSKGMRPPTFDSQSSATTSLEWNWSASVSPFPAAIDVFGDHSVYVLSAPGHLQGHINLLCRVSVTPARFALLAGDACHDVRLFSGECDIATWTDDDGRACCIHADIFQAKETIARLRQVSRDGIVIATQDDEESNETADVEVVFAHNWQWEETARERGRFWPGHL